MFGLTDIEACFLGSQSRELFTSDRFQESDSRENLPDSRELAAWKLEATGSPSASGPRDNRSFKNIQLTCQFASHYRAVRRGSTRGRPSHFAPGGPARLAARRRSAGRETTTAARRTAAVMRVGRSLSDDLDEII